MSQPDRIIKSFKDRWVANELLSNLVPGDIHHGTRADTTTELPFALMTVRETERESTSGNTAVVKYEAELKIYARQSNTVVGNAMRAFHDEFNLSQNLPSVEGNVIMIYANPTEILEDPDSEFGKDIIVGTKTFEIQIEEVE